MLDLLEKLGINFDALDSGHSFRMQQFLFPNSKPQSICSYLVYRGRKKIVWLLGKHHCHRSHGRYHD